MFNKKSKILLMVLMFVLICNTLNAIYSYDKTYTVYMGGNSHIDTAWQWTTTTTRTNYVPTTFQRALDMMNSYSDYTFNASAALHYDWIKNDNATMWNNIKTRVSQGRWAIVGGEWVEADTNMSGGELLIRQHLYGQRFFYENFGSYCTVGFLPDCFGFTAQLPQILKGCGMDYFVTTKLNWNDTNNFPHEIFKWNAPDGSQVIAYKPRIDYSYQPDSATTINYTLDEPNRHGIKKGLLLYGSGDAGGGPTSTNINNIRTYDSNSANPNIKMYTINKYFNDLTSADKANITDSVTGYMHLEQHRGTYTSQAQIKKNNRFGEVAVEQAEKFSSIAQWLGAKTYDSANLFNGIKLVMLNQFHDILPGSGTNNCVTEAKNNGATALNTLNSVLNSAISAIASKVDTTVSHGGVPVVVFNPLSFGRKFPVQTNVTFSSAPTSLKVYDGANEIPCQILSTNGNTATIVFVVDNVPSIGYKVVEAVANTGNYAGPNVMSIGSNVINSDKFQVTISGTTGNISAILDKTNNRQVLSGEGNVFQILDDTPAQWDAWNVDYDDMTRTPLSTMGSHNGISIVENGPAKCTYRIDKSYGSSSFQIYVTLYAGIDKIDFRVTGSWNESHKMLKTAFNFNVSGATSVTYDIAYGTISRPNSMTKAMFEVPAHKWADLSAGGYGVALLNNCKYGYDASGNRLRLSLLRSPKSPDPQCDMGAIPEFTYSIYPHTGDWKTANVMYKGWELNYPLIGYATTPHAGTAGNGKSRSFFSVNASNVILTAIKKAEDSSDYIIRMYETQGSSASPTITCPGAISSISETDMLERNIGTPSYNGNTFSTSLSANKIKTFKLNIGGTAPPTPTATITPTSTPTATPSAGITVKVDLSSYFNNDGFSYDSNRTDGNYDGGGANYSADLVNTAPTFNGVPFQLGPMNDGSNNVINATGQTISLPQGSFGTIWFLAAATQSDQTGTFQIKYTDGTTSSTSITEKDWCTSSTSGQNIVQTMAHRHNGSSDQTINTYIFAYSLTPTAGKTVNGLILPNNANIHVLAITMVPSSGGATPTATNTPTPSSGATPTATNTNTPTASSGGIISGATYKIVAKVSGKVVEVANASTADGAQVQQWSDNGGSNQRWVVTHMGSGWYKLTNVNSGKVLDVSGSSTADGAKIQQWTDNGSSAQRWQIVDMGGGYYKVICQCSNKVMDVDHSGLTDGTKIHQWTDNGTDAQRFQFIQM